jgi:magnesium-transporting ATPase (P-type)
MERLPTCDNDVEMGTIDVGHHSYSTPAIQIRRHISTTDVVRRASDIRILSQSDLRSTERLMTEKKINVPEHMVVIQADHEDTDRLVVKDDFVYTYHGIASTEAEKKLVEFGRNELPEAKTPLWYIFVQQLWQPM